ncbi:hypothetical protein IEO21_02967 [Rhodonia placenta]|uniref:LysM domain-containing protein n=1 Tax=Rhodonia placenta TaxID=104341 RepID=A0A8H7P6Q5_9APHY|nr:hypothetical protein IEO21_02967 [Postia placenta]
MPLRDTLNDDEASAAVSNSWATTSFSSAVNTSQNRPAIRRRGSDGTARLRNGHNSDRGVHLRARTVDDGTDGAASHPLDSATGSSKDISSLDKRASTNVTRQRSNRYLSNIEASGDAADGDGGGVMPKDSLPGVALKYGITLQELRRANQLWPSDPIHLRKELYIPLDKARHSREFQSTLLDHRIARHEAQPAREEGNGPTEDDRPSQFTIIRVPASRLSYFPPSSSSSTSSTKSSTLPRSAPATGHSPLPSIFTDAAPWKSHIPSSGSIPMPSPFRSPSSGLGVLINSLPLHVFPSARGLFKGRPSIDSTSGTPSSQSDDLEWEHEMEDVSVTSSTGKTFRIGSMRRRHDEHSPDQASVFANGSETGRTIEDVEMNVLDMKASALLPHRGGQIIVQTALSSAKDGSRRKVPYADVGRAEASPLTPTPVRTAQLEPSPAMQFPLSRKQKRSKSQDS